ncbi:hypothetical protein SAMD00019534_010690, partial [Acytostelium subglobosum LB1]|uniref:hypothetical protein n=1 Tax=Acytostelium subglobosum LB1 TaxID=1410327 RepID=UPI000644E5CD
KMKLKIGIFLSLFVIAGCILSFSFAWFQITRKPTFKKDQADASFYWLNYRCQTSFSVSTSLNHSITSITQSLLIHSITFCDSIVISNEMTKTGQIFSTSLSFLTIGTALALATCLLQLIIFLSPKACRSCMWKMMCIGCACGTVATLFIAFFAIFGLPSAFNNDELTTSYCRDRWCSNIYGQDNLYRWMPGGGWWAALGACFLALCSCLFTVASHR